MKTADPLSFLLFQYCFPARSTARAGKQRLGKTASVVHCGSCRFSRACLPFVQPESINFKNNSTVCFFFTLVTQFHETSICLVAIYLNCSTTKTVPSHEMSTVVLIIKDMPLNWCFSKFNWNINYAKPMKVSPTYG